MPRGQFPRSILVDTPDTPEDVTKISGVSDDFPVQLATRLADRSAGGLLRCMHSAARLSGCRVVLQSPRARHARLVADILARMSLSQ